MNNDPQYYIDCGYEDHGYVSPELSSSDTYPDYIKKEVDECVKKIQSHQSYDTVTFAFMTDIHYALSYNHKIRFMRTMNALKEIKKRVHIDKVILGGDYTNEGCKEYKSKCLRELRAQFDGVDYYPVNGNHDDGTIWDESYIKNSKSENHFTHEDQYTLFYNHIPSIGAELDKNNPSLYYMVNDNNTKTRYIMLDSDDIPYIYDKNGLLKYRGQHLFSMSQKQIDWLTNTALKFSEEGWSVAFFIHSLALPSVKREDLGSIRENMPILNDIISSYKTGAHLKETVGKDELECFVDVDFSNYTKADIIGFFVGDYHTDKIEYDNDNTPFVLTGNAVMYCTSNPSYIQRHDGDESELLFDIITVDKKSRIGYITRVGAGEDREFRY